MKIDEQQRQTLAEQIMLSPFVRKSSEQKLFEFFLRQPDDRKLSGRDVESEHFERPYGHPQHDEGHARGHCAVLRHKLQEFAAAHRQELFVCLLADGKKHGGYQLIFETAKISVSAAEWFWRAHLAQIENLRVICGDLLFFFDPTQNRVFRYYELNSANGGTEAINHLKHKHRKVWSPKLQTLQQSYLSTGEVKAFEILQKWFHSSKHVLLERKTSREFEDEDILKLSPILIGRPTTNRHMEKIVYKLCFQVADTLGAIKITKLTAKERKALKQFPLSSAGILGPCPGWKTIFGVVARCPNPSGYGHITVISADSQANVYSEIVRAITDEQLVRSVLVKAGWSLDTEPPQTFELLFAVTRNPEGFSGESKAELLLSRP